MILVDTSVWIEHIRAAHPHLREMLEQFRVVMHPLVMGEVACGTVASRRAVLAEMEGLPRAVVAGHEEAMHLLETRTLWGRGLGWVDLHLLAAAQLSACRLWTLDRRLEDVARELGVEYLPPPGIPR